jgi:hypothetical protein
MNVGLELNYFNFFSKSRRKKKIEVKSAKVVITQMQTYRQSCHQKLQQNKQDSQLIDTVRGVTAQNITAMSVKSRNNNDLWQWRL